MSIELTEDQQCALDVSPEFPPRIIHPRTGESYVLLHAEMYERVRAILEQEDDIAAVRETYPLVNALLDAAEAEGSSRERRMSRSVLLMMEQQLSVIGL